MVYCLINLLVVFFSFASGVSAVSHTDSSIWMPSLVDIKSEQLLRHFFLERFLVPRWTVRKDWFQTHIRVTNIATGLLITYPLCDFLSLSQQMSNGTIISLHPDCSRVSLPNGLRVQNYVGGKKQSWKKHCTAFSISAGTAGTGPNFPSQPDGMQCV